LVGANRWVCKFLIGIICVINIWFSINKVDANAYRNKYWNLVGILLNLCGIVSGLVAFFAILYDFTDRFGSFILFLKCSLLSMGITSIFSNAIFFINKYRSGKGK
jgi:hypothetical protein